jgi:hypothetical protein
MPVLFRFKQEEAIFMDGFFKLTVQYSTSHLFFPKIVISILIFLSVVIGVKHVIIRLRNKQPVITGGWRFFAKDADLIMLFGGFFVFALYVLALKPMGFLLSSMLFIFLFNLLFCRTRKLRSILISVLISILSSLFAWYLFGVLIKITLP